MYSTIGRFRRPHFLPYLYRRRKAAPVLREAKELVCNLQSPQHTVPLMELQLILTKNCKSVDKYEQANADGTKMETPVIGPVYLEKTVANGKEKITLFIKVG